MFLLVDQCLCEPLFPDGDFFREPGVGLFICCFVSSCWFLFVSLFLLLLRSQLLSVASQEDARTAVRPSVLTALVHSGPSSTPFPAACTSDKEHS